MKFLNQIVMFKILILSVLVNSYAAFSLQSFNPWAAKTSTEPPTRNPYLREPYESCPSVTQGIMTKLEVTPCQSRQRCPLVRGSNVTLDLEFIAGFPATSVVGTLSGLLSTMLPAIRFGSPQDLCASKDIQCPLKPGVLYKYQTTIFIKHVYPMYNLKTRVLIQGDKQDIACALIPVEIVAAS